MRGFILGLALLCTPAAVHAEDLRIATFNTEFLIRDKVHMRVEEDGNIRGKCDTQSNWNEQLCDEAFSAAVSEIANVLIKINADILVLTEIGPEEDVDALNQHLGTFGQSYEHIATCNCFDSFTGQNIAILSRFPLINMETSIAGREHYWEEMDDSESEDDTGISKGMSATLIFEGHEIVIYGLHLASESGGYDKDQQRIAQASLVRRHYLEDLEAGRHVVVAGDLNDRRGDPTLRRIRGLDDIGPDLMQTGLPDFFEREEVGERWTYEFQGNRNQIDHVLISDSVREFLRRKGIRSSVIRITDPTVSDHSPFIVDLGFRD